MAKSKKYMVNLYPLNYEKLKYLTELRGFPNVTTMLNVALIEFFSGQSRPKLELPDDAQENVKPPASMELSSKKKAKSPTAIVRELKHTLNPPVPKYEDNPWPTKPAERQEDAADAVRSAEVGERLEAMRRAMMDED